MGIPSRHCPSPLHESVSDRMKAAIRRKYVALEALKVEDVAEPIPGPHQVRIKLHATTVNRTDCANLRGKPFVMRFVIGFFKPRLPIPGTDFAGEIVALGSQVTAWNIGDRVFGFDDKGLSSQAEWMVYGETGNIAKIPAGITYSQAAASLEGAHYALNFLNKINVQPGHHVLVNGATGAIGAALLQFLKAAGAIVTATCSTPHLALVREMGADRVIDYLQTDFTKDEQRFDFVLDAVGKSTFAKCKPRLNPDGIYISSELGPMAQNLFLPLWTKLFGKRRVLFPFPENIPATMQFVIGLLERRVFRPLIDPRPFQLAEIAQAYVYAGSGQKLGNVIVRIHEKDE